MARSSTDPGNAWLLSEEEKDMMRIRVVQMKQYMDGFREVLLGRNKDHPERPEALLRQDSCARSKYSH